MQSYIAAHWRGEHTLARSFWINAVLIGLAVGVLVALVLIVLGPITPLHLMPVVAFALTLPMLAVAVWQLVGTWRSARHHIEKTGRKLWARVVQVLVVLAALNWAIAILQGVGILPYGA